MRVRCTKRGKKAFITNLIGFKYFTIITRIKHFQKSKALMIIKGIKMTEKSFMY